MADKRIDAHTNTTTVADVDEFIVDSGSNGTRNITYTNLKTQILGSTSIATIGNSVTEAIYNTFTDIGDLTQTGVTGATVAAQISQLNAEIGVINSKINDDSGTISATLFDTSRISVTSQNLKYKKFGGMVTVYGSVTFGAKVTTSGNYIFMNRLPYSSNQLSMVVGKIVSTTGTVTPYEAVSANASGGSVWFSYNGVGELKTSDFENKTFNLFLVYLVS